MQFLTFVGNAGIIFCIWQHSSQQTFPNLQYFMVEDWRYIVAVADGIYLLPQRNIHNEVASILVHIWAPIQISLIAWCCGRKI